MVTLWYGSLIALGTQEAAAQFLLQPLAMTNANFLFLQKAKDAQNSHTLIRVHPVIEGDKHKNEHNTTNSKLYIVYYACTGLSTTVNNVTVKVLQRKLTTDSGSKFQP